MVSQDIVLVAIFIVARTDRSPLVVHLTMMRYEMCAPVTQWVVSSVASHRQSVGRSVVGLG